MSNYPYSPPPSGGNPATTTALGISLLSHTPADADNPVVVETADPRMTNARAPTAGSVTTASLASTLAAVFVTASMTIGAQASRTIQVTWQLKDIAGTNVARATQVGLQLETVPGGTFSFAATTGTIQAQGKYFTTDSTGLCVVNFTDSANETLFFTCGADAFTAATALVAGIGVSLIFTNQSFSLTWA